MKKEKDGKEQSPKRNNTINLLMSLRSEIIYFIQHPTHRKNKTENALLKSINHGITNFLTAQYIFMILHF